MNIPKLQLRNIHALGGWNQDYFIFILLIIPFAIGLPMLPAEQISTSPHPRSLNHDWEGGRG